MIFNKVTLVFLVLVTIVVSQVEHEVNDEHKHISKRFDLLTLPLIISMLGKLLKFLTALYNNKSKAGYLCDENRKCPEAEPIACIAKNGVTRALTECQFLDDLYCNHKYSEWVIAAPGSCDNIGLKEQDLHQRDLDEEHDLEDEYDLEDEHDLGDEHKKE